MTGPLEQSGIDEYVVVVDSETVWRKKVTKGPSEVWRNKGKVVRPTTNNRGDEQGTYTRRTPDTRPSKRKNPQE